MLDFTVKVKGYFLSAVRVFALLIAIHCALGCVHFNGNSPTEDELHKKNKKQHNVIQCSIFDMQGQIIWHYQADMCLFLNDGRVIVARRKSLFMLSQTMDILWEKRFESHHQLNLGLTPDTFLVLGEEYKKWNGKLTKFDTAVVFNFYGQEIKRFSFYDHFRELGEISNNGNQLWEIRNDLRRNPDVKYEASHANSFYEIPENRYSRSHQAFKKGNFVINSNIQYLTFIVDKDLKNILWHLDHRTPSPRGDNAHDVQVLENGHLLIYGNEDKDKKYSSLYELDPFKLTLKTLFIGSPPSVFFSETAGGVQKISETTVLYSDLTNGNWAYEVETKSPFKRIWSMEFSLYPPPMSNKFQQAKRYDLSGFLEKNIGL